jgi:hypothetical protein
MPNGLPMNVLRRNDDAMKSAAGSQKNKCQPAFAEFGRGVFFQ